MCEEAAEKRNCNVGTELPCERADATGEPAAGHSGASCSKAVRLRKLRRIRPLSIRGVAERDFMARRYLVHPLPAPGPGRLPAPVSHHLSRVLRTRKGEKLVLFDREGNECEALVTAVVGGSVLVRCEAKRPGQREPAARVEVAFALPKGARAEWLFEHGTEVGASAFRPLLSARAGRAGRERDAGRLERWRRIVEAATGQCDRARVPVVHAPVLLETLPADPSLPAERWLAEPGAPPLSRCWSGSAVLVVGPEGGLTQDERDRLLAAGFHAAGLGPLTLRTETAALAGLIRLLAE
jgi:16S rRNA (uracil1498-N3)-methyltransferase